MIILEKIKAVIFKRLCRPFITQIDNIPPWVKRGAILNFIDEYKLNNFYESGTLTGDCTRIVASKGINCNTVELSEELYNMAKLKLSKLGNVKQHLGDSGEVLPKLINNIDEPTLFWLDGHYSGTYLGKKTAKGKKHTPINEELACVLNHHIKQHVILVDDIKCFDGGGGYPKLSNLLDMLTEQGHDKYYRIQVSLDMLMLTPRPNQPKIKK